MKIYYDNDRDLIIIQGLKQVFPAMSLTAVVVNNKIAIRLINDTTNVLGPIEFNSIQDRTGLTRNNILDTLTYLLGEFAKNGVPDDLDLVSIFNGNL